MNGYTIIKVNEGYLVSDKADTTGYSPQLWAFSTLKEALACVERLFALEKSDGEKK